MTIATLPSTLLGLKLTATKTPTFSSRVLTARNGKEQRAANWVFPKWEFKLEYEILREAVNSEFQTLVGFILAQQGQFNNFYYQDPYDHTATGQTIGTGDGATTVFRLVRTLGNFVDLIYYAPTITAVYFNGVAQGSGWAASASGNYGNDSITFTTAPTSGTVITADFTYNFVCRLKTDTVDFDQLWYQFWECKQLNFTTVF